MPKKDYYEVLGVSESASQEEIKRVYRDLAKKYHPDVNKGDKTAESRFKGISEAYNVLRDPEKRKKYDQMKKYGFSGGQPGGNNFGGFDFGNIDFGQFAQRGTRRRQNSGGGIFDEFFSVGGLGDIFSEMFDQGGRSGRGRTATQSKEKNIHSELTIPFDLAVNGGKQIVSIQSDDKCTHCNGTGAEPGANPKTCPQCGGRGTISLAQGFFAVNRTCPRCRGRGILIDKPCSICNGSGDVKKSKKVAITIPSGVKDGALLRLKGMGNNGLNKKNRGDLILKLHVAAHKFFNRKGNDVYCEIPIDIIQSIKGTKIRVKTVYNKKVELKVPPKTKDGKIFRMKGLGIKSNEGSGDQYVTIKVLKRSNLSSEEKKIVDEVENNSKS